MQRGRRPRASAWVAPCALATFCLLATAVAAAGPAGSRVDALSNAGALSLPASALLSPDRQIGAIHLEQYAVALFLARAVLQILAALWLWRSGAAAWLRNAFRRRYSVPAAYRFLAVAAGTLIVTGVGLPLALLRFRLDREFGLVSLSPAAWLRQTAVQELALAVGVGVIVVAVVALVERTRRWYVPVTIAVVAATLATAVFGGVPGIAPVESVTFARIELRGAGPFARTVENAPFRALPPAEAAFARARETSGAAAGEQVRVALAQAVSLIVAAGLAVLLADRIAFRGDDDSLTRLALVASLVGAFGLVVIPLENGYLRDLAWQADARALAATNDRAAAVRWLVRQADQRFEPLCPDALDLWYLHSDPPVGSRIARIQGAADPCRQR